MALVHLAVARGIAGVRKLVVLKSVRPELGADPRVPEMFLTEARLAATLNHPNVVQTFESLLSRRPVLVMEYLEGQPLSRIVRGENGTSVPLSLRLFVLKETLAGLEYTHSVTDLDGTPLNLVHRDVSPQNVFVTYDGHVKLLAASANTEAGVIKATVRYMAPEQLTEEAPERGHLAAEPPLVDQARPTAHPVADPSAATPAEQEATAALASLRGPQPASTAPARRAGRVPQPSETRARLPTAPGPSCSPPFYFDEAGPSARSKSAYGKGRSR